MASQQKAVKQKMASSKGVLQKRYDELRKAAQLQVQDTAQILLGADLRKLVVYAQSNNLIYLFSVI